MFGATEETNGNRWDRVEQVRWLGDWLEIEADDPALDALQGVPGARPRNTKVWRIHRTHLPLLSPEDQQRFTKPVPEFLEATPGLLRPYQEEAARFIASKRGTLLAISMGLGKTRTALVGTQSGRGIIIAPLITFDVWMKELIKLGSEIRLWAPKSPTGWLDIDGNPLTPTGNELALQVVKGKAKTGETLVADADVYLVNPEILGDRNAGLSSLQPDWTIFDEAHLYINQRTQRQQAAATLANMSGRIIALTGTPILKHVSNLYGILNVTTPTAFGSYTEFIQRWCGAVQNEYGFQLGDPSNIDELKLRLSEVMFARSWQDVSDDIPKITRERCSISLDTAQQQEYDKLARDLREVITQLESNPGNAVHMAQINLLRRFIGIAKINAAIDLVKSAGEPVVVWTWHRDVAATIAKATKGLLLTGETQRSKREGIVQKFQSGENDVIVATMAVAGLGIDLTRARISVFAEVDWTPSSLSQAEARVWRSTQKQSCISYWLVVDNTVEDRIVDVLLKKAGMSAAVDDALVQDRKMLHGAFGGTEEDKEKDLTKAILEMLEKSDPVDLTKF